MYWTHNCIHIFLNISECLPKKIFTQNSENKIEASREKHHYQLVYEDQFFKCTLYKVVTQTNSEWVTSIWHFDNWYALFDGQQRVGKSTQVKAKHVRQTIEMNQTRSQTCNKQWAKPLAIETKHKQISKLAWSRQRRVLCRSATKSNKMRTGICAIRFRGDKTTIIFKRTHNDDDDNADSYKKNRNIVVVALPKIKLRHSFLMSRQ